MAIPLARAKAWTDRLERAIPRATRAELRNTGRLARRIVVTKYFAPGGGRGRNRRPPNPPPGPLRNRTGDLRRQVRTSVTTDPRSGAFVLRLFAVWPYARIHELGGTVRNRRARRLVRIPARPYLRPGLGEAAVGFRERYEARLAYEFLRTIK